MTGGCDRKQNNNLLSDLIATLEVRQVTEVNKNTDRIDVVTSRSRCITNSLRYRES